MYKSRLVGFLNYTDKISFVWVKKMAVLSRFLSEEHACFEFFF